MSTIPAQIRQFVDENLLFGKGTEALRDSDSFLEQGIIDSTGVLELVTFIESQFSISVRDDELVPQNLDSIESLVTFIESKMAAAAQEA